MNWKSFSLNLIWFVISIFWIDFLSVQDKEWFIDGRGINNVCDVMTYLENDDIRPVGIIMTLPLFIPYIYAV
ncbi:TPA: YjeO family protein, partial [Escherichia coli]|nr:YjeO family protein [Escherichia coli]